MQGLGHFGQGASQSTAAPPPTSTSLQSTKPDQYVKSTSSKAYLRLPSPTLCCKDATSTRTVFWPLFVQRSCGCGLGGSMLACWMLSRSCRTCNGENENDANWPAKSNLAAERQALEARSSGTRKRCIHLLALLASSNNSRAPDAPQVRKRIQPGAAYFKARIAQWRICPCRGQLRSVPGRQTWRSCLLVRHAVLQARQG